MRNVQSLCLYLLILSFTVWMQVNGQFITREKQEEASRAASIIKKAAAATPRSGRFIALDKEAENLRLQKTAGFFDNAKYFLMNGNQIVGNIYDYGGVAPGLPLNRNVDNMVWHGLGDIYQFGPLVIAEVVGNDGKTYHISSDAINDGYATDKNPRNDQVIYGWRSLPEYVDPSSKVMASSGALDISPRDGKPDSWPRSWYNPQKGAYVWPGYLRQDVPNADLEILWGMDDVNNSEFPYYPVPADTNIRGLGLKVEGRCLQWSNSLAQNCIFLVYTVQNYSPKDLTKAYFGMYGDVDVGGSSADNKDDLGFFVSPRDTINQMTMLPVPVYARSIVYFWDNDGKGYLNLPTHYNGCKFLESPSNESDGIDNDGDRIPNKFGQPYDESQTDGIDNNKNWNVNNDDVGIDGVPGTNDQGEGDGIPTAGLRLPDGTLDPLHPGEPHYELTDLEESDQIGLTAFKSYPWTTVKLYDDELIWTLLGYGFDSTSVPNMTDIIFLFGSGKISLNKVNTDGSVKRFSNALLMGWTLNDILITAQTVQLIYNQNYQFIRPPDKPIVSAIGGDKKVTLYWDNSSENSVDPILGKDFEGYVIYRSTDPQFLDQNIVTDGAGSPLLFKALMTASGREAKWDVAKRPEPVSDSSALLGNVLARPYGPGTMFVDVNANSVRDTTLIDDFWKGYAPVPYDQRGVAYYLGDNTGLVHTFVDSNKVINGVKYYYAVVSFDHGDFKNYPPTECTKRISTDPITSQIVFDVNTASVTPGPRVNGYMDAGFRNASGVMNQLDHVLGTATGSVRLDVIDDLAIPEGADYRIDFADSMKIDNKMTKQLNYSIIRLTPVKSDVMIYDTNFVKIGRTHINKDSTFSLKDASGKAYQENIDFRLDTVRGMIRKINAGSMTSTGPYTVTYRYYGFTNSTYTTNEEANPVFDGFKFFVLNENLSLDTIKSKWVIDNKKLQCLLLEKIFGEATVAPIDVQIQFTNSVIDSITGKYLNPGDTLITTQSSNPKAICPFKIYNITKDTARQKIPLVGVVLEGIPALKGNGRWDPGEDVAILTPTEYLRPISGKQSLFALKITYKDTSQKSFGGEVLNVITKQPYSSIDKFKFTSVAGKYSPQKAASFLDRIKVVPNPYIGMNNLEPNDRLLGQTRGSRRIYFEHLPQKATIRIFTLSGELVRTLYHDSGLLDGREYWDLLNRDNMGVAYGVYIAHIEAEGVGERIIKFALIK